MKMSLIMISMLGLTLFELISTGFLVLGLAILLWRLKQEIDRRISLERRLDQQANRAQFIHQTALHIQQPSTLDEVLTAAVTDVQQFLQVDRALIYRFGEDGTGSVCNETVLPPYAKLLNEIFPEDVFPREQHQAYFQRKIRAIANIDHANIDPCLGAFWAQFDVKAKLVVPIVQHQHSGAHKTDQDPLPAESCLWGLLMVHQCRGPRVWAPWEVELMQSLATQVAIAIQKSELYRQLQDLNLKLEQRVQTRTEELAAANFSLRAEVAERQRADVALRYTHQTLQALIMASPRAIVLSDLEHNVKIWNPAAEQMFGWSAVDVINQPNPSI